MKKTIVIFFLLMAGAKLQAQDPSFTQFFANRLYFNPAFCGDYRYGAQVSMSHRSLWGKVPGKFYTEGISADFSVARQLGVGVMIVNDLEGQGNLNTTSWSIPFSVRIPRDLNRPKFFSQIGMMLTLNRIHINWDNLIFSDQLDAVHGVTAGQSSFAAPGTDTRMSFGISAGGFFEYHLETFKGRFLFINMGLAYHHMLKYLEDVSFLGLKAYMPSRWVGHVYFNIPIKSSNESNCTMSPGIVYEHQAKLQTLFIGANVLWYNRFRFGLWFRGLNNADALAIVLGVKDLGNASHLGKHLSLDISYSYDFTISRLAWTATRGSHEINLSFRLPIKTVKVRNFSCPVF